MEDETTKDYKTAISGSWLIPIELDLRKEESIKSAVKKINSAKDAEGKRLSVDILVNNAGMSSSGLMQMTSMDTLRDVMEVNFIGQMSLIQKVSKIMIRQFNVDLKSEGIKVCGVGRYLCQGIDRGC